MQITSHFIGIKVDSRVFVELFIALQKYLKENNLEEVIEIQDIHSLHFTLYYLEKSISFKDKGLIKDKITTFKECNSDFVLTSDLISYFKNGLEDSLGYATCKQVNQLQKFNEELAIQFKKINIVDNQFAFIPHISLFKVLKNEVFQQHKDTINVVLSKELNKIRSKNIFQGFFLFEVNSKFHPEIQFIVDYF